MASNETTIDQVQPQHTILCVDDERNILSALKRLFRPFRYNMLFADSGEQGLELLKSHEVDLVISDMRMPGMNGDQFLSKCRELYPDTIRLLLTGQSDFSSTVSALNEGGIYRFVSKPWDDEELVDIVKELLLVKQLQFERNHLLTITQEQNEKLADMNNILERKVEARTAELQQTADMLDMSYKEIKDSYLVFIKVFVDIINSSATLKEGVSENVAELSRMMAEAAGLSSDQVDQVYYAGLLHELGKLRLENRLLDKPFIKFSNLEQREYNKYPTYSADSLMAVNYLQDCAKYIRSHRESWNGCGFPDHLTGEDIPLGSRILTIAVDFFAYTEGLVDNQKYEWAEAKKLILALSGKQYDPQLILHFSICSEDLEAKKKQATCVKIPVNQLKADMVLSKDLKSNNGTLLLTEGTTLNARIIEQLRKLELREGTLYKLNVSAESIKSVDKKLAS